MSKVQVVLVIIGVVLIGLVYSMPKVIVRGEGKKLESTRDKRVSENSGNGVPHGAPLNGEAQAKINNFKSAFNFSVDKNVKINFADSLIKIYAANNSFDSAAKYAEIKVGFNPAEANLVQAGDMYSEALNFAVAVEKRAVYGDKAREFYQKALEKNPANNDTKSKLAMTFVSSESPMKAILLLREVIESDPKNELALYNLGFLSIQSGQFDKAADRFKKLVELYPDNLNGRFYLAYSYKSLGEKKKAREQFELVKKMNKDSSVNATVDSYLRDLK